jgi:hypothetical protein
MKYRFFIIFIILFSVSFAKAQVDIPNAFNEVRKTLYQQESDWNKGDIDAYMKSYWQSDSLKFLTKKGLTKGWYNILSKYKKTYPDTVAMGSLKFDILSMEYLCNERVMMIGKWSLKTKLETVTGYFSLLWQKIDGKWVIIMDHTS